MVDFNHSRTFPQWFNFLEKFIKNLPLFFSSSSFQASNEDEMIVPFWWHRCPYFLEPQFRTLISHYSFLATVGTAQFIWCLDISSIAMAFPSFNGKESCSYIPYFSAWYGLSGAFNWLQASTSDLIYLQSAPCCLTLTIHRWRGLSAFEQYSLLLHLHHRLHC